MKVFKRLSHYLLNKRDQEAIVYKKVGTNNFSALSSDQLKLFTSLLHKTSPETAFSLMNQFKDFRMSANWMV